MSAAATDPQVLQFRQLLAEQRAEQLAAAQATMNKVGFTAVDTATLDEIKAQAQRVAAARDPFNPASAAGPAAPASDSSEWFT